MRLEYCAHACFALTDRQGRRVLLDPCPPSVGYRVPPRQAEVTLVSHDHFDHNYLEGVAGATQPVRFPRTAAGIDFGALLLDHDREEGSRLGKVRAFHFRMDGLKVAHLGDLGRPLTEAELQELGPVDLLMVPCGGGDYTLGPAEARAVVQQVRPRWAVPMHYRTPFLSRELFPQLEPVDGFLKGKVNRLADSQVELEGPASGETEILWLPHKY
ncbi:MAG: MBL fold metallo-hydrolase [Candidatus Eremiobacterota bacterium]